MGDQDGTYPLKHKIPLPSDEFGEFKIEESMTEAQVFGLSRSLELYYSPMIPIHPDVLKYRKIQKKRREEALNKKARAQRTHQINH